MTMPTARPKDIRDVAAAAVLFEDRLEGIKRTNRSSAFGWYPYDSFAVFPVLTRMLREERRDLLHLVGAAPVLDIGCGDGSLSFFFESLGCRVAALDSPATNFNRTLGFDALRNALNSSVEFKASDIDRGLDLAGRTYGLAVCLGVLYHLKNPFGLLETLSRHARYCVLSTRIAQVTVKGAAMESEPVAYLLNPSEANGDSTNYWIFSEAGLRRILDRTGWDLCDYATTGCQNRSDPARVDRDQRAFCMIRSKMADPWMGVDLDGGWHALENESWRWTARVFTVRTKRDAGGTRELRFRFTTPVGPVRLHATVDGVPLPVCTYDTPGEHTYIQQVPPAVSPDDDVTIRFELDRSVAPTPEDSRELGVQVVFWSYDGEVPRELSPISIR